MRAASISLDRDLPARGRGLTDDTTSKVWGGCVGEGAHCTYDSDCCPQQRYDGSGKSYLRCIRNSAHRRVCAFV